MEAEYGGISSSSLYGGVGGFCSLKKHSEYRVVHIIEVFGIDVPLYVSCGLVNICM